MKLRLGVNTRRQRGQSLVEFALVLPVLALILSAVLEFGLAMDANSALEAASREGARVGAVLGNDGTQGVCTGAVGIARYNTAEATVDPGILATAQASLSSGGIDFTKVQIWIFNADTNGTPIPNQINKYAWVSGAWQSSTGDAWSACGRHDGTFGGGTFDDVGVQIRYTYTSKTGLLSFMSGGLSMTATAVMPIGPPWTLLP